MIYLYAQANVKNVATKLINTSKELAEKIGAVLLDLSIANDNTSAQALYEKIGFVKTLNSTHTAYQSNKNTRTSGSTECLYRCARLFHIRIGYPGRSSNRKILKKYIISSPKRNTFVLCSCRDKTEEKFIQLFNDLKCSKRKHAED